MQADKISFDVELCRGVAAYNDRVGRWWHGQAVNPSHSYAYRNIADYLRESFPGDPGVIVDYACGAGNLLVRLCRRFPESSFLGLDGSPLLLGLARRRLSRQGKGHRERVRLVESLLPDFSLPEGSADLVVFAFPNLVPPHGGDDTRDNERLLGQEDAGAGRALAQRVGTEDGCEDQVEEIYSTLLRDRVASLNMRRLLKPSGICVRVEYSNLRRDELPRLEALQTGFEEGSLDQELEGSRPAHWFRVVASRYFRSGVMEDVYHQSEEECDRQGGYFVTSLRAV